jgi:DNA-binding FadR family transcriptional regulator
MEPFLEVPSDEADSSTVEQFVFSHTHFHAVVASLAGNRVLQLMMQTIGQIVSHHVAAHADPREAKAEMEQDHADVAHAIAAGRPAKARARMEDHIRLMSDFYKDQIGARMDEFIEWR